MDPVAVCRICVVEISKEKRGKIQRERKLLRRQADGVAGQRNADRPGACRPAFTDARCGVIHLDHRSRWPYAKFRHRVPHHQRRGASGGQIEAGLKAIVGAVIGAGGMFAMRRWLNIDLDLHSLGIGPTSEAAGLLPAVTLPLIAAVLGAFYEADNTPEPGDKDKNPKAKGKT